MKSGVHPAGSVHLDSVVGRDDGVFRLTGPARVVIDIAH
jgi:hypothetical protein